MSKLEWDKTGEKFFETGVDHGVLYTSKTTGEGAGAVTDAYGEATVWNGLTNVTESPSGAEPTDLWADNIKYASIRSREDFGLTIEAYMYPDKFAECDGSAALAKGVRIGQQPRKQFGFSYRTLIQNDTLTDSDDSYKLHLVYGCSASPSEKSRDTVNDSPDATQFSWEVETIPVPVTGFKPTAHLEINSLDTDPEKLKALEAILYGSENADGRLPLPDEVKRTFA